MQENELLKLAGGSNLLILRWYNLATKIEKQFETLGESKDAQQQRVRPLGGRL